MGLREDKWFVEAAIEVALQEMFDNIVDDQGDLEDSEVHALLSKIDLAAEWKAWVE